MILQTNAIVLNRMKYKNSSLIARIFTEDAGKISIIMNGAGKRKGNVAGIIEPPNIIQLDYYQRKSNALQTCKEVSFVYHNTNIKTDIIKLGIALAIVEVVDKTCHDNDPNPNVYHLTSNALQLVDNVCYNPKLILIFFLLELIKELGFMIDLENEDNESLIMNNTMKQFLLNLNAYTFNTLDKIDCSQIDLMEIITNLEIYIKQHLKLNRDIESLKMIREMKYG